MEKTPRRILVVDDEVSICIALARSLRREGYEVVFAHDPQAALELLRTTPIDLVISDQLMPQMTGLEFLKLVHDRHPDLIRIMLTGQADVETAIKAINQGEIYRFLTKPWDDAELKVTVFLAFEKLDLERQNRRLLAVMRQQQRLLEQFDREHPETLSVARDASGAIVLDALPLGQA
ncbi:MAG: response regulator [Myxococcota bacterium]